MITDPVRSRVSAPDRFFGISANSLPRFVRLKHPSGLFLNVDGTALTDKSGPSESYRGTIQQARNIRDTNALAAECKMVK
jgi:hypothetical protein